ncbi:MAG: hypothetical protein K1X55_12710 [Chitinophagales bacterium]|nr:hypothetical protein [Chitinophagales bacterium]
MKRIIFWVATFFLFTGFRHEDTDKIYWKSDRILTWDDFKASPDAHSLSAQTSSAIEMNYQTSGNKITWHVASYFIPSQSWVKNSGRTDYILAHEQLHFDLTEVYAKMLRKRYKTEIKTAADHKKMNTIYAEIRKVWEKEQARYDKETNHSINKTKQADWNTYIKQKLEELNEY